MSTSPDQNRRGPTLLAGRYELGATLGRGGMADVYRAVDRLLGRPVAVKVLRETATEESDRARFVAEARTLARLSHSGLVTILDAGFGADAGPAASVAGPPSPVVTPDQPFLVMELVEGPTLAQAIAQRPLPPDDVASIGAQVAAALAHVHANGIVHRDLKPGNVLMGDGRRTKLADFGIARLLGEGTRHTRTGHTIGTAAYLAPEQVSGQDVSGETDVYSLGLVLLEALTGTREYPGPAIEAAVARLTRAPRIPVDLPAPWQQLLTEMTDLDPDRRPSAAEVAERLEHPATMPMPMPMPIPMPVPGGSAEDATQVLTGTAPNATQVLTGTTPPAGAGPPGRARALGPTQLGLVAAVVVLVLALLVAVLDSGGDDGSGASDVPSDTPSELRAPLEELHGAVHGGQE